MKRISDERLEIYVSAANGNPVTITYSNSLELALDLRDARTALRKAKGEFKELIDIPVMAYIKEEIQVILKELADDE